MPKQHHLILALTVLTVVLAIHTVSTQARANAKNAASLVDDMAKLAGRSGGLVVLLDSGDTALVDAFAKRPGFLLQTIAGTEARTSQLREHVRGQSKDSKATAITYAPGKLPYADGIVSVFVAEKFGPDSGINVADLVRCLSPNAKAFLRVSKQDEAWLKKQLPGKEAELKPVTIQGQSWTVLTKKRPAGMDEWPQFGRDSARSRTSKDTLIGPPVHLRWISGQRRSRSHKDHPNGSVSAGGRNFMLTDEGPRFYVAPARPVLVCRDAYNGLVLWRRELPIVKKATQDLNRTFRDTAMCATADRLYSAVEPGGKLHALDASNGKTVTVFEHNPTGVLLVGDRLVLTGGGPVRAVNRNSGKTLWTSKVTSDNVLAEDGFVYAYLKNSRELACLRISDGKQMWQKKYEALSDPELKDIRLRTVIDGVVIVGTVKNTTNILGINAKDGTFLWSTPFTMYSHGEQFLDFFRVDGQLWVRGEQKADPKAVGEMIGRKIKDPNWSALDPKTGKTVRKFPVKGYAKGCAPDTATANYLIAGKSSFFDIETGKQTKIGTGRSVCGHGWMPANGMLYTFPTDCRCDPYLRGDMAMAPGSGKDPNSMNPKVGLLTKGPAYGAKLKAPAAKEDWPIYRGAAERGGYLETKVPAKPKVAWKTKIGGRLTSPVIADGKVVVSAVESHTIHAFDSRSGKPLWKFVAGNRVDQSPTYARGRFVFGCRDGSVYCLNAADGKLIWRYQIAPADQLIVAYGRVESARPILGSVLEENGEVFATAGRHTGMDGGILVARLNLDTGKTIAQAPLDSRSASMNDIIVKHGDHIVISKQTLKIADLKRVYPGKPTLSAGQSSTFEDDTYAFRTYWTKSLTSRPQGVYGGDIIGHLLCFNDKFIYGADSYSNKTERRAGKHDMNKPGQAEYNLFRKPNISDVKQRRSARTGWRVPVHMRVRALVLTDGTLFAAGNADPLDPNRTGDAQAGPTAKGVLQGFNTKDGAVTFTHPLPAPPIFDGLSAARGALYLCTTDGTLMCLSGDAK